MWPMEGQPPTNLLGSAWWDLEEERDLVKDCQLQRLPQGGGDNAWQCSVRSDVFHKKDSNGSEALKLFVYGAHEDNSNKEEKNFVLIGECDTKGKPTCSFTLPSPLPPDAHPSSPVTNPNPIARTPPQGAPIVMLQQEPYGARGGASWALVVATDSKGKPLFRGEPRLLGE
eukprot:GHVR01180600.1.p1 GENE.GHVR01180600.1~~GHVR01180600.1.p1  ORF type:complete len:171 (-),score=48.65 GHVR01180600.1:835-1347(-)